jgi:hypothetical protein
MSTELLLAQHRAILAGIDEVARAGDPALALRKLVDHVGFHLACEDLLVYPRLTGSADRAVAVIARQVVQELAALANGWRACTTRWLTPGAIAADPESFRADFAEVAALLRHRIAREETEVYPLLAGPARPTTDHGP